jgi:hypothetical protein
MPVGDKGMVVLGSFHHDMHATLNFNFESRHPGYYLGATGDINTLNTPCFLETRERWFSHMLNSSSSF